VKHDPGTHKGMHLVLALKLGVIGIEDEHVLQGVNRDTHEAREEAQQLS
jgi:hypothetical protein